MNFVDSCLTVSAAAQPSGVQKRIRVLIADDEHLARERLKQLLHSEFDIEIVGECVTGDETVKTILAQSPDIVFLDINMPELDGFQVIEALPENRIPAIIFVTAYGNFALRAFEIHAVDYLLKPFDRDRFQSALKRARARLRPVEVSRSLPSSSRIAVPDGGPKLVVRSQGRIVLVRVDEIDWISAEGNYVGLRVGKRTHLMRTTITALAPQLPETQFVRISRSVIVNVERVKEIMTRSHGDYVVVLVDETRLAGSRTHRSDTIQLLKKSKGKS